MNKLEEMLNNMTKEERANYDKRMSEIESVRKDLGLDYGTTAGLLFFLLLGGDNSERLLKGIVKQRVDESIAYQNELIKNNFEKEKAYEKDMNKLIEDCHRKICDYLYLNNIHLIKTIKDGKYEEITSYEMADDIVKQLKEK